MYIPNATILDLAGVRFVPLPAKTTLACAAIRKAARAILIISRGTRLPEICLRGSDFPNVISLTPALVLSGPVAEAVALELAPHEYIVEGQRALHKAVDLVRRDAPDARQRVEAFQDALDSTRAEVLSHWHTIASAAGWLIYQDRLDHEDFAAITHGRMTDRADYFRTVLWSHHPEKRTA